MSVKDLICKTIGLPADFLGWIEKISDNIDVDFSDKNLSDAIIQMSDPRNPETIGTAVAIGIVEIIENHFKEQYQKFDENKFGFELNGYASAIFYDSELVETEEDMACIMERQEAA